MSAGKIKKEKLFSPRTFAYPGVSKRRREGRGGGGGRVNPLPPPPPATWDSVCLQLFSRVFDWSAVRCDRAFRVVCASNLAPMSVESESCKMHSGMFSLWLSSSCTNIKSSRIQSARRLWKSQPPPHSTWPSSESYQDWESANMDTYSVNIHSLALQTSEWSILFRHHSSSWALHGNSLSCNCWRLSGFVSLNLRVFRRIFCKDVLRNVYFAGMEI